MRFFKYENSFWFLNLRDAFSNRLKRPHSVNDQVNDRVSSNKKKLFKLSENRLTRTKTNCHHRESIFKSI